MDDTRQTDKMQRLMRNKSQNWWTIYAKNHVQDNLHRAFVLADRTDGRAIGTVLRLSSVCCLSVVCDVMYCG